MFEWIHFSNDVLEYGVEDVVDTRDSVVGEVEQWRRELSDNERYGLETKAERWSVYEELCIFFFARKRGHAI